MKENIQNNKEEIVKMLNEQVKEGIEVGKKLHVEDNIYGVVITNLLHAFKEAEQMSSEILFDKEQERLKKEYELKSKEEK